MGSGDAGPRRRRLSRSGDFNRAYREGSSRSNRYLVVYEFPRGKDEGEGQRLGVSVGRKVGGAVERNRVKRVLREAFWDVVGDRAETRDFVIVARKEILDLIESEGTAGVAASMGEVLPDAGERST